MTEQFSNSIENGSNMSREDGELAGIELSDEVKERLIDIVGKSVLACNWITGLDKNRDRIDKPARLEIGDEPYIELPYEVAQKVEKWALENGAYLPWHHSVGPGWRDEAKRENWSRRQCALARAIINKEEPTYRNVIVGFPRGEVSREVRALGGSARKKSIGGIDIDIGDQAFIDLLMKKLAPDILPEEATDRTDKIVEPEVSNPKGEEKEETRTESETMVEKLARLKNHFESN